MYFSNALGESAVGAGQNGRRVSWWSGEKKCYQLPRKIIDKIIPENESEVDILGWNQSEKTTQ